MNANHLLRLFCCALFFQLGCGSGDEQRFERIRITEEGLRALQSDIDDDGIPDVFRYFEVERAENTGELILTLVRTELDLTSDGLVNVRREYDEFGDLILEEMDGDLNGQMDHIVTWEQGMVTQTEDDDDGDGNFDEIRYYNQGFLSRVERDDNGDGAYDFWAYYDRYGLNRIGFDTNGDGEPDTWTQRPR